jgi:hypothetical protein
MKIAPGLLAIGLLAGCADTTTQCCLVQTAVPRPPPAQAPLPTYVPVEPSNVSVLPATRVLVIQSTHTDRLTEVVGVVDVHAEMGGQDAALEALKQRAAEMGADAVLGVEFHHGHGEDEPTHLSGLAVRFIEQVR